MLPCHSRWILCFVFVIFSVACSRCSDAFSPSPPFTTCTTKPTSYSFRRLSATSPNQSSPGDKQLTHEDILWKIRLPPKSSSLFERLKLKLAGWSIRLDCRLKREEPPLVLCPRGGQAILEAWHKRKKIGRFGITTESGPCLPAMQQSAHDSFGIDPNIQPRTAAIIYMFVEESMRGRNVGYLALEAIGLIHAAQGCDFTVLVADDKTEPKDGSGAKKQKLVEWYERFGFARAPKLQEPMGSPDEKYGVTMIGPTNGQIPTDIKIKWW